MNDTRSTNRASRFSTRIAVVLCLLLAIGLLPMAAFAAPTTVSDVEATYLNTATINLMATGSVAKTFNQLDSGAVTEGESATTSLYGAHILKFWSTDTSGVAEATVTAPFFVDENVLPVVGSDAGTTYTTPVTIKITATDNFNGSGVDFLCYRVDGGKIVTAIAPARVQATKVLLAKIATVQVNALAGPPDITPTTTPPQGHYGPSCAACHTIIIPTPAPTSTPEPTGTPAPSSGVSSNVAVAGAGTHTIEYWAQDIARNSTAHIVKTFTLGSPKPVLTSAHVSNPVAPAMMSHSKSYKVWGSMTPRQTVGSHPVRIYRYRRTASGSWKSYGYVGATMTSGHTYCRAIVLGYPGVWRLRAYTPADRVHSAAWSAGYDYVTVK